MARLYGLAVTKDPRLTTLQYGRQINLGGTIPKALEERGRRVSPGLKKELDAIALRHEIDEFRGGIHQGQKQQGKMMAQAMADAKEFGQDPNEIRAQVNEQFAALKKNKKRSGKKLMGDAVYEPVRSNVEQTIQSAPQGHKPRVKPSALKGMAATARESIIGGRHVEPEVVLHEFRNSRMQSDKARRAMEYLRRNIELPLQEGALVPAKVPGGYLPIKKIRSDAMKVLRENAARTTEAEKMFGNFARKASGSSLANFIRRIAK